MNGKGVFQLRDMIGSANCAAGLPDGRYVRAVPEPFWFGLRGRFSGAWEVICGRAFPTEWPKAGELEEALMHRPGPRPTIDQLEKILASEPGPVAHINPDGSVVTAGWGKLPDIRHGNAVDPGAPAITINERAHGDDRHG